ncbi:MAG: membrane protein insertase YidC [Candidatus Adiutrix intracellularis]|jgi:YidC/Oxa1 family membrane protein insertase|nr:membrane protein insertase YidC [Candidatus Adiutrix intracellularis]
MNSRSYWLLAVVIISLLIWSYIAPEGIALPHLSSQVPTAALPAVVDPPPHLTPAPASVSPGQVTVTTPEYTAVIAETGGLLTSFTLNNYYISKLNPALPDRPMELVTPPLPEDRPLRLTLVASRAPDLENAFFKADQKELNLKANQTGTITLVYNDPAGLTVTRRLTFTAGTYLVQQQVSLTNGSSAPFEGRLVLRINTAPFRQNGVAGRYDGLGALINNHLLTDKASNAPAALAKNQGRPIKWAGYMDQYFLTALVVPGVDKNEISLPEFKAILQDHGGLAVAESRTLNLPPGQTSIFDFDFYYGPKAVTALRTAGHDLTRSIDLGWFSFLATPLAALLRWIYVGLGNYGLAIIIVTVLIKIVLWPLTTKSYRSMKNMQNLQPKVAKIREKYDNDKEALNREIMHLYKTFKINPLGGCLPMILQIPFFIAFYRVLDSMLELRGAPFMLWIKDLAAPDRLGSFDIVIPFFDQPTGVPVLTLLMGLSMIVQQKISPNTMGDPTQAKIMMMMPVVFTFILINMPAGLVLYWLINNILSIAQQTLINRPGP